MARLTLSAAHRSQLQSIQNSPKFKAGKASPFPGYSVTTPTWDKHPGNTELAQKLVQVQQQLCQELDEGLMVPVSPESFHLTLADLIWGDSYKDAIQENPLFEEQLRDRIAQCFQQCEPLVSQGSPIAMQVVGLILRPRAVMVGLVSQSEEGYQRIVQLRRTIYQNSGLMALGIEQQYNFTAHITLGYFGAIAPDLDRDRATQTLADISAQWFGDDLPTLTIEQAQLCKFDDMNHFYRKPDFPILTF